MEQLWIPAGEGNSEYIEKKNPAFSASSSP